MSGYLRFWYRRTKALESKFHEVTDYVQRISDNVLISYHSTLDNQRLEFQVNLVQPYDEDDVRIYPTCGDDIVVTDENITEVYLELCGWIFNTVPVGDNYLPESIPTWVCKVKHRDFSNDYDDVDEVSVITSTALFNRILNNHTKSFLGGTLPSGRVIPKFTEQYNPISFPSFKYSGKQLEQVSQATKTVGTHYILEHFVEEHNLNNIAWKQSIKFIDDAGDNSITSDWIVGINNQILVDGEFPNSKFIDADTTPDEPETILTETEFKPEFDATPVVNIIRLNGFMIDATGKVTFETFAQDTQKSEFLLKKSGLDVLYCARLVDCKILSIGTPNLVFNIDLTSSQQIAYDKDRLNNTGYNTRLVMRITSGDIEYIRKYTISGQTVTLDAVGGTEIAIPALLTTDTCWHVNGYDVLKDGLDSYPADEDGFVKKILKFGERASVIFSDWDKPNETETVVVGYYALDNFRLPKEYVFSKEVYDVNVVTEEIPFPITQAQFETISGFYEKLTVPREKYSLKSKRENVARVGWKIPVNLIYEVQVSGNYFIDSVAGDVICNDGRYKDKPSVEQTIILSSYRDDLADFLAQFKNQYALTQALLEENTKKVLVCDIIITVQLFEGFSIPASGIPTGLVITSIVPNVNPALCNITISWTATPLAMEYAFRLSKHTNFDTALTGIDYTHPSSPTVTFTSALGNTLYFEVASVSAGGAVSDWSDSLTIVVTPTILYRANYQFTTGTEDSSGNGYNGTLFGSASVSGGKLNDVPGDPDGSGMSVPSGMANFGTSNFNVEASVKWGLFQFNLRNMTVFNFYSDTNNKLWMYFDYSTTLLHLVINYFDGGSNATQMANHFTFSIPDVNDLTTYHKYKLTRVAAVYELFIDDVSKGTVTALNYENNPHTQPVNFSNVSIGCGTISGNNSLQGYMDYIFFTI